ncbi:peptidoglycan DD-metalloendopeptidase family protein [Streptomyces sp. NPDC001732]
MRRRTRRLLAVIGAAATLAALAPDAVAAPRAGSSDVTANASRPTFKMPFRCGQKWLGSNWNGHSPAHSIDWNHYDASGTPNDLGRRVLASAGGEVVASYYSTSTGYGNTVVIAHGNGWQTRYSHLRSRNVQLGDRVAQGRVIGQVGASSALYDISPHLHYEQIHDNRVVVAVVQGVTWADYLKRYQVSNNGCG